MKNLVKSVTTNLTGSALMLIFTLKEGNRTSLIIFHKIAIEYLARFTEEKNNKGSKH